MPSSPNPALDIPFMAPRVAATLEDTHVMLEVTPEHQPLLAYRLAIPRSWAYSKQFGPAAAGPLMTEGLGFFAGATGPGAPVIAVTVTPVPFEIPIDAWARMSLATEGWQLVSTSWFPGAHGLFFDVVGTRVFNELPEVRRTTVRSDGSNIISVNCFSGSKNWDAVKELFWVALDTFHLQGGTGSTRLEPWMVAVLEHPNFKVAYPRSWNAEPVTAAVEPVSAVDIRLLNASRDTLLAYLQVKVEALTPQQPAPALEASQSELLAKLMGAGFIPGGPLRPLTEEDDPRSIAVDGWLGGFQGTGRLAKATVAVRTGFIYRNLNPGDGPADTGQGKGPGMLAALSVISPLAPDDPLVALRAQRAFEIARATVSFEP